MFKKILLAVVVVLAVLAVVVAMQPDEFRVSRQATIDAPAEAVFEQVNNLHNWNQWSPWAKMDPNATLEYQGPESGEGAAFSWDGNNDVGAGKMTIVESKPNELVRFQLDFLKPMAGTSTAEFTFEPKGDATLVTWRMSGKNNFMAKAIGLVMNCEKMVGEQFEQGFANLKTVVEKN